MRENMSARPTKRARTSPSCQTEHDAPKAPPPTPTSSHKLPRCPLNSLGSAAIPRAAPPAVRYDFAALAAEYPELRAFTRPRKPSSVDFSRPGATLALTRTILRRHFDLELELPAGQLVPTVPARQQYLSWAFALLGDYREVEKMECALLDVGTGPSAIYALLATRMTGEGWRVTATDIDADAIENATRNIVRNSLQEKIQLLLRTENDSLVPEADVFSQMGVPLRLTVCNPPFYDEGRVPTTRPRPGTEYQLETHGGEFAFLCRLARESRAHCNVWFTSLVGIKSDLAKIVQYLHSPAIGATQVVTTALAAGKRTSRWAIAWRMELSPESTVNVNEDEQTSKWRSTLQVQLGVELRTGENPSSFLKRAVEESVLEDSRWSSAQGDEPLSALSTKFTASDGAEGSCTISVVDERHGAYAVGIKVENGVGCLSGGAWEFANQLADRLRVRISRAASSAIISGSL